MLAEQDQAKRIYLYRNGDAFSKGRQVVVSHRKYPTLQSLKTALTKLLRYPISIERIYSLDDKSYIKDPQDFTKNGHYVCLGREKLNTSVAYDRAATPKWTRIKRSELDKRILRRRMASDGQLQNLRKSLAAARLQPLTSAPHANILFVYRHGAPPTDKPRQYIVSAKTAQSLGQVYRALSETLQIYGGVKHLCTTQGKKIKDVADLYDMTTCVAIGNEKFSQRWAMGLNLTPDDASHQSNRSFPGAKRAVHHDAALKLNPPRVKKNLSDKAILPPVGQNASADANADAAVTANANADAGVHVGDAPSENVRTDDAMSTTDSGVTADNLSSMPGAEAHSLEGDDAKASVTALPEPHVGTTAADTSPSRVRKARAKPKMGHKPGEAAKKEKEDKEQEQDKSTEGEAKSDAPRSQLRKPRAKREPARAKKEDEAASPVTKSENGKAKQKQEQKVKKEEKREKEEREGEDGELPSSSMFVDEEEQEEQLVPQLSAHAENHVDFLVDNANQVEAKAKQEMQRQRARAKKKLAERQQAQEQAIAQVENAQEEFETAQDAERERQKQNFQAKLSAKKAKAADTAADNKPRHAKPRVKAAAVEVKDDSDAVVPSSAEKTKNEDATAAAEKSEKKDTAASEDAKKDKDTAVGVEDSVSAVKQSKEGPSSRKAPGKPSPRNKAKSGPAAREKDKGKEKDAGKGREKEDSTKESVKEKVQEGKVQAMPPSDQQPSGGKLAAAAFDPSASLRVSDDELEQYKNFAATKIQAAYRGFSVRKALMSQQRTLRESRNEKGLQSMLGKLNKEQQQAEEEENDSVQRLGKEKTALVGIAQGLVPSEDVSALPANTPKSNVSFYGVVKESFVSRYLEYHEKLGDGNFADVLRCVGKLDNKEYAVKIIDKRNLPTKREKAMIIHEIRTMRTVDHPNCIKLFDVLETKGKIYLVMELVRGGDLFDFVVQNGKIDEARSKIVVKDMLSAISCMHAQQIVHRDLKPENVLMMSKKTAHAKIGDFGLSMVVEEPLYTVCGTPTYVAPEIIDESTSGYGIAVDCWAIGIITYILLCGFPPFSSATKNQKELFRKIRSGKFSFPLPYWEGVSANAKDFIKKLLVVDPKKRLTAKAAIEHPWLSS